ncbi:TIGR03013 family XrtA/PEP-CTERM system glycosyltransferase [Methylomonas sp. MED-D]|uniref:Sugar transferase n=1 Tax=Methylomonas koyamae TaxID=702114 RepID=A0A177PFR3_9GAMM|nr:MULTISPECIES: TIGR03013 family XrtA/PEP-CTERM system glycosyltransferase [Methylomonas]NJA07049.1 TIGR03013 family PEP-CTERM/XrtA system glycosyltransferase [Methylococcaceae bacterium WWC4]MDT4329662.1 TIGR03013 family PEP-CTERM/XrtA system glycosyltransferase [Methylomonas sp. MV1]OAI28210.1 sugar transferase [Methylomonas koyamae]OHX38408.1 sugar transferase [Methylomonas sp. LWB]WGS87164.1 TIGR03013 family PEP-CTERM/XrtA system glycosyltransferase [Methylomonas sp. UP202]
MIRIFRHYISTAYLWLLILEWLVFFLAMYCGATVRFLYTASWYTSNELGAAALMYSMVFTAACSALGLYRKTLDKEEYNILQRISFAFAIAVFMLAFIYYVIPDLMLARSVLISALILSYAGLLLTRHLFYRFVNLEKLKRRVLVIGCGQRAGELSVINSSYIYRGFEIVGYVTLEDEPINVPHAIALNEKLRLNDIVEAAEVDEIVIAVDDRRKKLPVDELLDVKMSGVQIMDLQTFYEREQRLIYLETLSPSWLVFSDGFVNDGTRPIVKRTFDVIASLLLLSVSWWIMVLTMMAIYVESGFGAPVFYRQRRVGYRSEVFNVIKFRSMRVDAEKNGAQWAAQTDDRVTKVGKFIRKYRIDELPQLLNVLKGDMSFVGPRPERPEFVQGFEERIPYYKERHRVKPGITGWAQLCYPYGASEYDTLQKLQYDLYYVKNYSLFLDLTIMMSTVEVILWGKGAR